ALLTQITPQFSQPRLNICIKTALNLVSRKTCLDIPSDIYCRVRMPVTTSRLPFPRPHPTREYFLQCIQIRMPLRLKIGSLQTIRNSNGERANVFFAVLPDIKTNIFFSNKNTPMSAIN